MDVSTNVLLHASGKMAIMFDDPNFARCETIIFDETTGYLHAVLEDKPMSIGHITGALVKEFSKQSKIQLSALRPDGSMLNLDANLIVIH